MKKTKILLLFTLCITHLGFAQLTPSEVDEVITIVQDNSTDAAEVLTIVQNNSTDTAEVTTIAQEVNCDPIDDIFNLRCPRYQNEIDSSEPNDYSGAIALALSDADANGGGVILFPGNRVVEIDSTLIVKNNITFRAASSKATIKASNVFTDNQMVTLPNRLNIGFENIIFDGSDRTSGVKSFGVNNANFKVTDCVFQNFENSSGIAAGIGFQGLNNVEIKGCLFKNSNFGITFDKRNSHIRIENNKFENTLTKNPIRIQGNSDVDFVHPTDPDQNTSRAYSTDIWILNNHITMGRAPSIIDDHASLTRDSETGAVSGLGLINGSAADDDGDGVPDASNYDAQYTQWRWQDKGSSAIYITSGNTDGNEDLSSYTNYHLNVVIEGNVAIGPDYGFFDGGSADLYSLKDIVRLHCVNNVARNSGDLGFAIERCRNAIISSNTADRNNSFGIAIASTRNAVVSNNICDNNALRRDYLYNSTPYGGILISGSSINNVIEGNQLYTYSSANVSYPSTSEGYTVRSSPTDYYGIVFRANYDDDGGALVEGTPYNNKVGINHYSGHKWGTIYNQAPTTQIAENFSATDFPKNRDYPLGTWIRNSNLNTIALGWSVINRVEATLHANWQPGDLQLQVVDESNTLDKDDIIGVMLDDGNVHWTIINDATFDTDHYNLLLDQYPTVSISDAVEDPGRMNRIIILRWKTISH